MKRHLPPVMCLGLAILALPCLVRADDNKSASVDSKSESSKSEDAKSNSEKEDSNSKSSEKNVVAVPQPTYSPVQSAARPYNLDIAAKVQVAASDAASKNFQKEVLPEMLKTILKNLPESRTLKNVKSLAVDPSQLVLKSDSTLRAYFVSEGAGYSNTLGVSSTNGGPLNKGAELIFPNVSSSNGYGGSGKVVRTSGEPLMAGDFVDLGSFKAGTPLDFFLIANGANGGKDFFSTTQSLNADGIIHAVSFANEGSPYLLISFEDLYGGGDKDYNDVVFAVSITKNGGGLGAPEPSLAAGSLLAGIGFFGFGRRRRTA